MIKSHKKITKMSQLNNKVPDKGMTKMKIPRIREITQPPRSQRLATGQRESLRIKMIFPISVRLSQLNGKRLTCSRRPLRPRNTRSSSLSWSSRRRELSMCQMPTSHTSHQDSRKMMTKNNEYIFILILSRANQPLQPTPEGQESGNNNIG